MPTEIGASLRSRLEGTSDDEFVNQLFAFMLEYGKSFYDESVTQLEHALQCADLARQDGQSDECVAAALLHDVGHLILDEHDDNKGFLAEDLNHEEIGADLLQDFLSPATIEPIRMHVVAKRYLCTTDDEYHDRLSLASKRSFVVQGGMLSDEERSELEANPHLATALALRIMDDRGKQSGLATSAIERFADCVVASLRADRP